MMCRWISIMYNIPSDIQIKSSILLSLASEKFLSKWDISTHAPMKSSNGKWLTIFFHMQIDDDSLEILRWTQEKIKPIHLSLFWSVSYWYQPALELWIIVLSRLLAVYIFRVKSTLFHLHFYLHQDSLQSQLFDKYIMNLLNLTYFKYFFAYLRVIL